MGKSSARRKEYYEGILQLRNPTKEVISAVRNLLEENRNVFIAKEVKLSNGLDLYLSSQKYLQFIGKNLQNRFGGELVETAKLVSRSKETSKDLYRITVLFRYPKFKKGDVVDYKGREVKVINFSKKVYIEDMKTHKKEQADFSKIKSNHA